MKQIYIIALCALVGASSAFAADGGSRFKGRKHARKAPRTEVAAPIWRPASETVRMEYDPAEDAWLENSETTFIYDSRGNVIESVTTDGYGISRQQMAYDENDCLIRLLTSYKEEEDGEWINESQRFYTYDPIITDFYVERMGNDWHDGEWVPNFYCEINVINRNADGNIESIVKSLPLDNKFVEAYKSQWTYDPATGKAVRFDYLSNSSSEPDIIFWEPYGGTSHRNLVWDTTNGQMTGSSMYDFTSGDNRILSADVYYNEDLDGHFIVEYTDKPGEYFAKDTFIDPGVVGTSEQKEITDAFGSNRITQKDFFDEEGNVCEQPTYTDIYEFTNDEHGNQTHARMSCSYDGVEYEVYYEENIEYDYDSNGNILQYTVSTYDFDEEAYIPSEQHIFGEYVDLSGVENVVAGAPEATFAVYTLQGICVDPAATAETLSSLPAGLYIAAGRKFLVK